MFFCKLHLFFRTYFIDSLERIEKDELIRCDKECNNRIDNIYTDQLDISLRKLRPRYPLCRTTEKQNRSEQINSHINRYNRHKSRCYLLLKNGKQQFKNLANICNKSMVN